MPQRKYLNTQAISSIKDLVGVGRYINFFVIRGGLCAKSISK